MREFLKSRIKYPKGTTALSRPQSETSKHTMYPGILLNYTRSRLHRGGHMAADVHANSIAAQRFNRFPIHSRDTEQRCSNTRRRRPPWFSRAAV